MDPVSPPPPPPSPADYPDLTGTEVLARVTSRLGKDAVFKFSVGNREFRGLAVPELRERFHKSITSGTAFSLKVAGPPDANGRYPLAEPEEEFE